MRKTSGPGNVSAWLGRAAEALRGWQLERQQARERLAVFRERIARGYRPPVTVTGPWPPLRIRAGGNDWQPLTDAGLAAFRQPRQPGPLARMFRDLPTYPPTRNKTRSSVQPGNPPAAGL
jgi:hypothetical protein